MVISDTYTVEYANSELGYKAVSHIFFTALIAFVAFISRNDVIASFAWISLASITAYVALMTLNKLIFRGRKAILVISPEGIKDVRLGPGFIPWDDIEKIDVPAPRRSLGMTLGIMFLGFCLIVVAIILSDTGAIGIESLDWSQPNHHIWLLLTPRRRVTKKLRGSKDGIRLVAGDMQHVCIAVSDLTHRKQGLLELIVKFHQRYKKAEKTEKVT